MGAVKTIPVGDSFRETRDLLTKIGRDPMFIEISGNRLKVLLEEVRLKMIKEGIDIEQLQNVEIRWEKLTNKKPQLFELRRTAEDTQEIIHQLIDEQLAKEKNKQESDREKTRIKGHIHMARNTLQKLFLHDNQEIIIRWEIFQALQDLLRSDEIKYNPFQTILQRYKSSLQEWKRIYQIFIFIINEDEEKALVSLKERIPAEELKKLGNNLEKMMDEITATLNHYESEHQLY